MSTSKIRMIVITALLVALLASVVVLAVTGEGGKLMARLQGAFGMLLPFFVEHVVNAGKEKRKSKNPEPGDG